MSASACAVPESLTISSSVEELPTPFPLELQRVFDRLSTIGAEKQGANIRKVPSEETLDWARYVLLRVMPSAYLIGANINPFETEIHVTWEDEDTGKSVIVFFPAPQQLKLYWESVQNDVVVEHKLVSTDNVADVSDRLRWFFQ